MTYSRAKVQGQRSVFSEDGVKTNGRMDRRTEAIALPPSLMRSVTINQSSLREQITGQEGP